MAKKSAATTDVYPKELQKVFSDTNAQYAARMEDMAEFTKDNFDAFFASAAKVTESAQEMTDAMLGFTRSSMDANMAAMKEMSSVKDPSELLEKQTAFAKSSMDQLSDHMGKMNEMAMTAVKQCVEPMNARFAAIGEVVKDTTRSV
ncbi:MAG: phasin family protein [Pseudomonadota bacterium]